MYRKKLAKQKYVQLKFQDHLIYIPKGKKERRVSHLQDLTSISKEQLARRFSCYDFIEQKTEAVESNILMKKQQKNNSIRKAIDLETRKLRHSFSLVIQNDKTQKKGKYLMRRQNDKQNLQVKIKLTSCNKKMKINQIYSQYSSVQTTARAQNGQQESMTKRYQQFCKDIKLKTDQIPCVYLQTQQSMSSNKLLVYYHANGEDLINTFQFVTALSAYFKTKVMVIQYPGYSIYHDKTKKKSMIKSYDDTVKIEQQQISSKILNDIPFVMSFIQNLGIKMQNTIVIGRSIGTGPAIEIASKYQIECLILLSPFAKFSQVAQKLYGKVAGMVVKQPFDNFTKSKDIKCPVLILHGLQDKTIHYQQSIQLSCNIRTYCSLRLIQNMSHNKFNFQSDIFFNIQQFLTDIGYEIFQ